MNVPRLRIGIAVTNLPRDQAGGAQMQAVRMAGELAAEHDVTLFARGGAQSAEALERVGVRAVLRSPFPVPGARLVVDSWIAARQVVNSPVDALVCYQTLAAGLVGSMARRHGVPFLVYIRGRHEYRLDRWNQFRLFAPGVYGAADRILVQSPALAREVVDAFDQPRFRRLQRHIEERVRVIPNGVDERPMRSGTGKYLIFVGRLIQSKGVDLLLAAMRGLPGIELLIVGDGPDRRRFEQAAAGLKVSFHGAVPHEKAIALVADAMCLVLPSRTEAFPNVVLEAMSLGVPVIATRVGGIPGLVEDGENGVLVPCDDTAALAQAIAAVTSSPRMREEMGRRAHARAAQFSWKAASARLADEIRSVVGPPRAGARRTPGG